MKINRKIIEKLKPCKDRLENYVSHYGNKTFDVTEFLKLDKITHRDKLWVVLRLVDPDTQVIFAMDCVFAAYAAAYAADNAAYAAAYAANAAAYAADTAYAAEQERQIEALIYLIGGAV